MPNRLLICLVATALLLWADLCAAQDEGEGSLAPEGAPVETATPEDKTGSASGEGLAEPAGDEQSDDVQEGANTDSLRKLDLGDVFYAAHDWDAAIERYQEAAESPDEEVAARAREKLALALARRTAEPLGLRQALPSPASHWWPLDYVFLILLLILLLIFLAALSKTMVFGVLSRTLVMIVKPGKSNANWRVVLSGSVEDPERSLVFDELVVTLKKLKALRQDFGGQGIGVLGRRVSFLYPISLSGMVEPGLVVRGVDVGRLAALLQALLEHYTYRLEVRVDRSYGSAYVFASLKWGAHTEEVWQIPEIGNNTVLNFREIGRLLAYEIFGSGMVRQ